MINNSFLISWKKVQKKYPLVKAAPFFAGILASSYFVSIFFQSKLDYKDSKPLNKDQLNKTKKHEEEFDMEEKFKDLQRKLIPKDEVQNVAIDKPDP